MDIKAIFEKALSSTYIIIDEHELNPILESCEIIRTENTHLSDYIRLIKFDGRLFIQELSLKNEIILRKIISLDDADKFIQERLDIYERKWDGCGCKIDYYE
ncbi:MAG: hypothetical protein WAU11_14060 [Ignavibacteriaceae bacterium]